MEMELKDENKELKQRVTEMGQRIAELEERINKANTILVEYMGQWAGVCDIYLPENMLPIYNTVSILRGEG